MWLIATFQQMDSGESLRTAHFSDTETFHRAGKKTSFTENRRFILIHKIGAAVLGAVYRILNQFYPSAGEVGGIYQHRPIEGDKPVAAYLGDFFPQLQLARHRLMRRSHGNGLALRDLK